MTPRKIKLFVEQKRANQRCKLFYETIIVRMGTSILLRALIDKRDVLRKSSLNISKAAISMTTLHNVRQSVGKAKVEYVIRFTRPCGKRIEGMKIIANRESMLMRKDVKEVLLPKPRDMAFLK